MTVANLLEVLGAMTGSLIIVADVDWKGQRNSNTRRGGGRLTSETSRLNTAVTPDQESTKDWLGQDVQDTVKHSLGVR